VPLVEPRRSHIDRRRLRREIARRLLRIVGLLLSVVSGRGLPIVAGRRRRIAGLLCLAVILLLLPVGLRRCRLIIIARRRIT
jgi:hypothetical protein